MIFVWSNFRHRHPPTGPAGGGARTGRRGLAQARGGQNGAGGEFDGDLGGGLERGEGWGQHGAKGARQVHYASGSH
jgi:hypothetical protein